VATRVHRVSAIGHGCTGRSLGPFGARGLWCALPSGLWCALPSGLKWCALASCWCERGPFGACGLWRALPSGLKRCALADRWSRSRFWATACRPYFGGGRRGAFLWLRPDEQVVATRVVHNAVRHVTGDVEIHLSASHLALRQRRWVDALWRGDLEQNPVVLAVSATRVEVGHYGHDRALKSLVGGRRFPEGPLHRVRNFVGALNEVADSPALHDRPIFEVLLIAEFGSRTAAGRRDRCAVDNDHDGCYANGCCHQCGGECPDIQS
jgi:hypothetical protein